MGYPLGHRSRLTLTTLILLTWNILSVPLGSFGLSREASGVQGRVLVSPSCPAVRVDGPPCEGPLEGAQVIALDAVGRPQGRVVSERGGRFFLKLKPGRYRLTVQSESRISRASDVPVVVNAGEILTVQLFVDIGLR